MTLPKDPIKRKEYLENMSKSKIGFTTWNKGKKGFVMKPESRIRKWFERLDQRIPREKEKWFIMSDSHKGIKHSSDWNKNIMKGLVNSPNFKTRNENISKSLKGRDVSSWIHKVTDQNIGHIPWNKGKKTGPLSPEHRKLISIANTKPKPPFTKEHKQNISKAMLGEANARRGVKHKPETIEAIKIARSLQVMPMKDSKPERMIQLGLTLNGIKFEKHKSFTDGKGFYHRVDIFIEPNICIEVDGDYWHANPKKYCVDYIIKTRKNIIVNSGDIWRRDSLVNNKLISLGNKVIRIWESDITSNPRKEVLGILQLLEKEAV